MRFGKNLTLGDGKIIEHFDGYKEEYKIISYDGLNSSFSPTHHTFTVEGKHNDQIKMWLHLSNDSSMKLDQIDFKNKLLKEVNDI